jgi:hypothetical protein
MVFISISPDKHAIVSLDTSTAHNRDAKVTQMAGVSAGFQLMQVHRFSTTFAQVLRPRTATGGSNHDDQVNRPVRPYW